MYIKFLLLLLCCSAFYLQTMSQDIIQLALFAEDYSFPVDIVHTGDDRLFVVEKRGIVQIVDTTGQKFTSSFLDIRNRVSSSASERGLLGMCFHPDFSNNGFFYLNYTRTSDGSTVIARYSVDSTDENAGDPNSEKVLLVVSQPYENHNAGDLEFGPDGYLYIGLGDGGNANDPQNRAQNPQALLGKMLRIDVDNGDPYAIPADNPFADDDFTLDEIWALGLRNPWRYSFDRETGDLYIADVGQKDWEEVNVQESMSSGGQNYGWRCYEGNAEHITSNCGNDTTFTFPVYAYGHEGFNCSGSITGGYVYRGVLNPDLYGYYIFTDFCTGKFRSWSTLDSTAKVIFRGEDLSYTTFGEDAAGELYVASLNGDIFKIEQTSTATKPALVPYKLTLYPVPAKNRIFFDQNLLLSNEQLDVSVSNTLGINVLTKNINMRNGLDISSLAAGLHVVSIIDDEKHFVGKFIVE
jgi:glucose/arabinose dehydrogenase